MTTASPEKLPPDRPTSRLVRWTLLVAGLLCTLLGAVGAFLPVLPTTPFLLLAAACFVRASPRLHRRLLANRIFGPYLRQWQEDRTIPPDAKRKAYALVILTFALSIVFVDATWHRVGLLVIGLGLTVFLLLLPTTARSESALPEPVDARERPADSRRGPE